MKLLDGTVHITDMGYCEADRDITLFSDEMPEADFRLLRQWFTDYETLFLSLPAGFYTAAPYSLSVNDGTVAAVFMLKARVDT